MTFYEIKKQNLKKLAIPDLQQPQFSFLSINKQRPYSQEADYNGNQMWEIQLNLKVKTRQEKESCCNDVIGLTPLKFAPIFRAAEFFWNNPKAHLIIIIALYTFKRKITLHHSYDRFHKNHVIMFPMSFSNSSILQKRISITMLLSKGNKDERAGSYPKID